MISQRWSSHRFREAMWGYLMIAPMVLGFGIFFYLALGASAVISMTKWDVLTAPIWVGLQNYITLLNDPKFWQVLWNTTRYTIVSVPLGLIVSLLLALALNTRIRFRNVYRLIFFLPVLTMPVAIAVVWKWIFNPDLGLANQIMGLVGFGRIKWLSDVNWAMNALVIMSVWSGSGYGMVIFLAGLQNIPREYYEAASVDGANWWQSLTKITIPLLTPTIFFNLITSLIGAFQVFDIIYTMTKGGPLNSTRSIVYNIYEDGFKYARMGTASATAWILFIIILVVTVVQLRVQKRWVHYE
ncbi:MAG: sugar ABC transporter permease [Anaerolineae bacterium]|nr:sugar ABC transporter permease [Anaerolineae bacterium]